MRIVQITTDSREHFKDYGRLEPYFGAAPEALFRGFSKISEAEVHIVSCLRSPVAQTQRIADNIFYHPLVVPKLGWMKTGYRGCIIAVRSLLAEIQPDIVHGQGTEKDSAMSAVYSGFPNVVTIHGNMQELHRLGMQSQRLFGTLASILESHALARTAGVFCNSAYTRSLVEARTKATWLVPNAIRSEFLSSPRATPGNRTIPRLVNVGLLTPRKRQLEILRCISRVVKEGHKIEIVFVGGKSEGTDYGKLFAKELAAAEAEGWATHAGFLDAPDLISLMDHSEGFVHFPSEEAFGLVVAEAMARHLKFFGADLGGIRDIARGVPGAELHQDFDSLRRGIISWLAEGAPGFSEAHAEVAKRYSPTEVAIRHMEIYREVLAR